ncbi:MAG: class I SAM-dependent methyltransferase [Thermocladium sp.]
MSVFLGTSRDIDKPVAGFGVARWALIDGKWLELPGGYDNITTILSLKPLMIYMGKSSPWFVSEIAFRGIGVHISDSTIRELLKTRPMSMTLDEIMPHICDKSGRFSPEKLRRYVRHGRILDAAAGTGRYLLSLDGYLVGMDKSIYSLMGLLKCSEREGRDVDVIVGSFNEPPLRDGFDYVVIMHALYKEHEINIITRLKEIGKLIIWGEHLTPPAAVNYEEAIRLTKTLGCSTTIDGEEFIAIC